MEPWNNRKMNESTVVREKVSPAGLAGRVWMEIIAAVVAERASSSSCFLALMAS
jgi:hypothetical protein